MSPRDTTTGSAYESVIEASISRSCQKYSLTARSQVIVGEKPGGGRHKVDYEIVSKLDENIRGLVSCKTQHTSGTAEEKIAYEVIKLLHTMENDSRYVHSWIIMGGTGWSSGMRLFVTNELPNWIPAMRSRVSIYNTDQLLTKEIQLPATKA